MSTNLSSEEDLDAVNTLIGLTLSPFARHKDSSNTVRFLRLQHIDENVSNLFEGIGSNVLFGLQQDQLEKITNSEIEGMKIMGAIQSWKELEKKEIEDGSASKIRINRRSASAFARQFAESTGDYEGEENEIEEEKLGRNKAGIYELFFPLLLGERNKNDVDEKQETRMMSMRELIKIPLDCEC